MTTFYPNQTPTLTVTFRDSAGQEVDPVVVEFALVPPGVTDENGYITYRHGEAPEVTKPGPVGTFQFQRSFTGSDTGNWTWQARGDNVAQAYGSFTIIPDPLDLPPEGADHLVYLSLESARRRYNGLGLGAISDGEMVDILLDAEALLDDWLGWRAAPTTYVETIISGRTGQVLLPHQPVIDVLAVELIQDRSFPNPTAMTPEDISACWVPGEAVIGTPWCNYSIQVRWIAGLSPLPRTFAMALWALLKRSGEKGTFGDLYAVQNPAQHMTMLSLPGGLSKQFATPSQKRTDEERTEVDQILRPLLDRYRKTFIV